MPCKKHFGFLATAIVAALMVTLAVALPGVSADGDEDKNREIDQSEDQALPLPDKTELNHPNLGSQARTDWWFGVEDGETTSRGCRLGHSGAFQGGTGGGHHPPDRQRGRRGHLPGGERRFVPERGRRTILKPTCR